MKIRTQFFWLKQTYINLEAIAKNLNLTSQKTAFLSLIALFLWAGNIPITKGYEVPEIDDSLWEMSSPELPPLQEPEIYLVTPEEINPLQIILSLQHKIVKVYQGEKLVTSYPVAIGRRGWETPQGEFKVIQMQEYPAWQHPFNGNVVPPGPNNPLGARWIGFWTDGNNYIGFHGTPEEELIGRAVSHGCVRMKNKDVKELYKLVSLGTPVTVK